MIRGHNTVVHEGFFMIYKPGPINGGKDSLICGMDNLPHYGVGVYYESDLQVHPNMKTYPRMCWMHFMRKARYGKVMRPFNPTELISLSEKQEMVMQYTGLILPLMKEANSPYADLKFAQE